MKIRKLLLNIFIIVMMIVVQVNPAPVVKVEARETYNVALDDIFANAGDKKDENIWEYKEYSYQRRESGQPVPIIKVRYNADGTVTVRARYNDKREHWYGRPYFGITVPKGFEMPKSITRRMFYNGERLSENSISVSNWDSASRFSDIGRIEKEWGYRVVGVGGYDGNEGLLNSRFKDNTQALFITWEKPGKSTYELEYTTRVTDYKAKNNVLATLYQLPFRYSRHAGVYAANPKPIPPEPPVKTVAETYDLKRPVPQPVVDPQNLTDDEQNEIIEKIKEANEGLDDIANVVYDGVRKEFKVEFDKDHSSLSINQNDIVYKKPEDKTEDNSANNNDISLNLGERIVLENEDDYNSLNETDDTGTVRLNRRREIILRLINASGDGNVNPNTERNNYGSGFSNIDTSYDFGGRRVEAGSFTGGPGGHGAAYYITGTDHKYYYVSDRPEFSTEEGLRVYRSNDYPSYGVALESVGVIPWDKLATYENNPADAGSDSITNEDKQATKDAISRILDPSKFPGVSGVEEARDNLINQVDGKTTREELNELIKKANEKASEIKIAEANKQLDLEKERAKRLIESLTEISDERKENLLNQIDDLSVSSTVTYESAKETLNSIVKTGLKEDLDAAKASAKEIIESLQDKNVITDGGDKDVFRPDELNTQIDQISSDNLTEEKHLEEITKIKKLKNKVVIDAAREAVLKKLEDSSLNNKDELANAIIQNAPNGEDSDVDATAKEKVLEAEKALRKEEADALKDGAKREIEEILAGDSEKIEKFKEKIDAATSEEEIETIINEAKVDKHKADAIATIENLENLNKAQKDSIKEIINAVMTFEDLEATVNDAIELNASMGNLIAEVKKSKELKDSNQEPYSNASDTTKQAFEAALTKSEPIVDKNNGESTANLDNYSVINLYNELRTARLSLKPDGENISETDLIKKEAEEIKAEIRNKNKETKEKVNTIKSENYNDFTALGNKDDASAVGTIVNEAESAINAEIAKLENGTSQADEVRSAIEKIRSDAYTKLEKEKLKAAVEKLKENIDSVPTTDNKTEETIAAYNKAKSEAEEVYKKANELLKNNNANVIGNISLALDKVIEADKKLTEKENGLLEKANTDGLNEKIATLDKLLEQARPSKFVAQGNKDTVDRLKTEANNTLGDKNSPAQGTAREIAGKNKPTAEEVSNMINTLEAKINALTTALDNERSDSKTKLDQIINTLLPDKDGTPNPNKQNYLDKSAKLTNKTLGADDLDKESVTNTPNDFIDTTINGAIDAALNGFENLNNAQVNAAKVELKKLADSANVDGNLAKITEKLTELKNLDDAMANLKERKLSADKILEQVRYIKEKTESEKTEFANTVSKISNLINKDTGENKTLDEINKLINDFYGNIGLLDGKAFAPNPANKVVVVDPNNLTEKERRDVLKAIIDANSDIANKIDENASSVSSTGVATIVYKDASNENGINIAKTPDSTIPASDLIRLQLNSPAKTLVSLNENGVLSDSDKEAIKNAIIAANPTLANANPPRLTSDNITFNDDGSVTVVVDGNRVNFAKDDIIDDETKPSAKSEIAEKLKEYIELINNSNLSDDVKNSLKEVAKNIVESSNETIETINSDSTSIDKDASYNEAVTNINKKKDETILKLEKEVEKLKLEEKADEVTKYIDTLNNLSKDKVNELKNEVKKILESEKDKLEKESDKNNFETLVNKAISELEKVKAKSEIEETAEKVKKEIDNLKDLSKDKKTELKNEIDKITNAEKEKVDSVVTDGTNPEKDKATIDTAKNKAISELEKVKAKSEIEETAEKVKKEIDNLKDLSKDKKTELKNEIDKITNAEKEKVDNVVTDGTNPEKDKATIDTAKNKAISELEKVKAKAEIEETAEKVKKEIDNLKDLSKDKKTELKNEIDKITNAEKEKVDNVVTEGTNPKDDKATIDKAKNKAIAELENAKARAKADIEDTAEKVKKEIDALHYISNDQKAELKKEVDKILTMELSKIDNETNINNLDNLVNNAKSEFEKIMDKAIKLTMNDYIPKSKSNFSFVGKRKVMNEKEVRIEEKESTEPQYINNKDIDRKINRNRNRIPTTSDNSNMIIYILGGLLSLLVMVKVKKTNADK